MVGASGKASYYQEKRIVGHAMCRDREGERGDNN